ncbi:hypothetical protein SO802_028973 [Lithocarpus litseifolius]|uniref:Retrotransposon gag domain-containing protein n=1 Tax=Lithocarpus litseifolius TaxID=425828 RepID=A0AAW2BS12_9ROSI
MPNGYQSPKFLQFDGKGNPKQHGAHFVETCENVGTQEGLFVKQFVRSLKGNAFDWYTDLELKSIDSWEQLEREFLNRFYSTCRTANERRPEGDQRRETHRSSLKEWEKKVYPFLDADMPKMLKQLLKLKLIELPECKRLEKIGKVDDLNYCKYHRIISHPIKKCFVFKELIMKLTKERKIDLDFNDVAQSNLATFACVLPSCMSPTTKHGVNTTLIQFGSMELIQVHLPQKASNYNSNDDKRSTVDEEKGWTMVAYDIPSEVLPIKIPSMESKQGENKHVKFITRKDVPSPKEGPEYGNDHSSESTSNSVRVEISTPSNSLPFLRYVPLSRCKNGQSPFTKCLQSTEDMGRPSAKLKMEDVAILKENHVMPLTSSTYPFPLKPLNGFMRSS